MSKWKDYRVLDLVLPFVDSLLIVPLLYCESANEEGSYYVLGFHRLSADYGANDECKRGLLMYLKDSIG